MENKKFTNTIFEEVQNEKFSFSDGFSDRVMDSIALSVIDTYNMFNDKLVSVFYRFAYTSVAAIILLLIAFYISSGDMSFNSIIGTDLLVADNAADYYLFNN